METYLAVDPAELELAMALTDEAFEGLEDLLPGTALEVARRVMIGRLLWTAWGREQIVGCRGRWQ